MRVFLTYLGLELKRMLKSIPFFLAGAIVLVFLAGTIAFSASKILYGGRAVEKIKVGVVLPADDKLASMALSMVTSLESVESLCEFEYMDENKGMSLLKKGKIFALIKVPEGMIQGIMDGSNTPAVIVFPEHAGLEASVFRELTNAGASLLSTSQAGIYAAGDLLTQYGENTSIARAGKDLNSLYMKYALSRENVFKTERVSASGTVPVATFYSISAAVLVLLLLGIPAASMMCPYGKTMEQKLYLLGIGRGKRTAARILSLTVLFLVTSALPLCWCIVKGYVQQKPGTVAMWLVVCLSAAAWILLLYELSGSTTAGILVLFLSAVVMLFLSGGFVPGVFLPDTLHTIGTYLPSTLLIAGVQAMVEGDIGIPAGKLILFFAASFLLAATVRRDYE